MTPTKLFKGLSTCLLRLCGSHLIILWLGVLSCQLVYAETCPVDSMITYDQNNEPIAKTIYQYDEAGRTIEEAVYSLQNGVWFGDKRTTYSYYDSGKIKDRATWVWSVDGQKWLGSEKYSYEYNENGLTTMEAKFLWGSDDWICSTKSEYQYDAANRKILDLTYIGSGTQWIPKTKQELNYDAKGNTIFSRYWNQYDVTTGKWIGYSWEIVEYNSVSNPQSATLKETYEWRDGDWYGTSKVEYGYNSKGIVIYQCSYQYNSISKAWDNYKKNIFDFDDNENQTLIEQYQWEYDESLPEKGYWKGIIKEEHAFDEDNNPTLTTYYQWDDISRQFVGINKSRIEYDEWENIIYEEAYVWKNDASMIDGGYWKGVKLEEHTYINTNQLVEETIYTWDDIAKEFVGNTFSKYAYDDRKNLISDEHYQWATDASLPEGGYWKGTKYEVTTYNDKNVETDKITYQWDDTNRRWLGSSKSNYEFDAANNLILEEQYTWVLDPSNPAGGYWQGTKKESFGYNAANQQIKHVTYEWGSTINNWIGKDSVLSNYDSSKNQTLNEQYTWTIDASPEGGYWHGTIKEEYTFNKNKQQTSSLIYTWNDTQRSWDYVSKTKSEYDAKKNLILDERYEWQNGEWVGTLKKEYAYNAQGQQTMFAFYAWDEAKKAFVGTQKEETELDAEGRTILHATYTWGTNNWIGKSKTEYIYTTTNQIATEIISKWSNNTWVYSTKTENTYTNNVLTSYIQYNWVNNAWVAATKWEQVNANTERTYEWWNNNWSITQETSKEYDGQNRLIRESDQNYSHGTPTSGSKTEYTYTGDNLTQQSSYVYNDGWVETDRTTYTYSGNVVETISSTWTGSEWQGVERLVQEYSNERDYTLIQYEWKNGDWSGISKTGYTYYANGKEKSVIIYRWSGTTWIEDTKTEYEYIGTKNIVTAMYQMENGSWVGQSKVGNYYDEGEDLTTATWTWTNGAWAPNTKMGESHDADGNLTGQTTYSKKGNDFIYNTKTEYEYGATTKDKTTATYKWNTTTNSWQGISKSGVTYNGSKIASETTYTWISGLMWQPNQKKEYEYGVQAKDLTTAIYQWDATISTWVGVSKSGVTYASNGKIASEFSYTWSGTDWVGVTKTEYEYGDGKNNSVATYKGEGTEWVGVSKVTETYTENGNPQSKYTYCWKENTWADSLKQEYEYDEYDNNILFIDAQWKNGAWSNLTTSTKWNISYYDYAAGKILVDEHYTWSTTRGWIGTGTKQECQYDEWGYLILDVKYKWNRTEWVGTNKHEWIYNKDGVLLLNAYSTWDTNKGWKGSYRYEYEYNEAGQQTMYASYSWDTSKWKWKGTTKTEHVFDEAGNETATRSYKWDTSKWDWIGKSQTITEYDDAGRLIYKLEQSYNNTSKDWQNSTKYEYLYDNHGNVLVSNYFTWIGEQWVLRIEMQNIYDQDDAYKKRIELNGTYTTTGEIQSYNQLTYFYHCDPKFTITVQAEQEGEGEVTGSGIYTYYARPQIVAIDDPNCFIFTQWTDGETNATRRIIVIEDATYTAEFTPVERTTSASVKDNIGGSVKVTVE